MTPAGSKESAIRSQGATLADCGMCATSLFSGEATGARWQRWWVPKKETSLTMASLRPATERWSSHASPFEGAVLNKPEKAPSPLTLETYIPQQIAAQAA